MTVCLYAPSKVESQLFLQQRVTSVKASMRRVSQGSFMRASVPCYYTNTTYFIHPTCPIILTVEPTLTSSVPSSSHTPVSTCTFQVKTWGRKEVNT